MFQQSSKQIPLSIFVALLLAVPVYAVTNCKISNYGNARQIWFEAEDCDERNPNTATYSPAVDQAGAFGKAVGRTGEAGGMIRWTFDISAAGGKGGTWYFWGRVLNPNNRSDFLLIEGDPQGPPIPSGPPFPAGDGTAPFVTARDRVFEETVAAWGWIHAGHEEGHTKQLPNGKNNMYIFRREGPNATVFWDVFMWTDDPAYRPTDDDYRNAQVYRPGKAADGSPTGEDVPLDTVLSWTAGTYAGKHDVYFGTNPDAVAQATTADATGTYKGRLDVTTYAAPLEFGQTYYWRVDEVNKTPDNAIYTGNVWSFTTEPYAYPIKPAAATASGSQPDMGPEKTIDGSGMTGNLHGTVENTMWLSDGLPAWIQYEFDKVYKLQEMQVWNSNQAVEVIIGYGAKQVTVETSLDGVTWTPVANVPEFAQAPMPAANMAATTTINLGPVDAKYVKLTIHSNWGGLLPQAGLSEVRFSHIPVQAREPVPADGATNISVDPTLDWRPGRGATSHKVYLSADRDAVANGTAPAQTVTAHSLVADPLNYNTTYYWKVDEVGTATYSGDVWSFTTQEFQLVDGFEGYNDVEPTRLFDVWVDGFANATQNGAIVGLDTAVGGTFCDTTVFHGGKASMPFAYDNAVAPLSEATLSFPARDWTARGIKSLTLWFQGAADNTGKLYVRINNTKVLYPGAAGDLAQAGWMLWSIDLSAVAGVSKVTKLAIGVEGAGAKGTLHVDDIRLSTTVVVPVTQPAITAVVRANGQSGTRTDAVLVKTYTGSTAPASMGLYGLMDGAFVFSDRVFTWVNTPPALVGAEYVLAFNQDKSTGETDVTYTVTLGRAATVFVGSDDRFRPNQQATVDAAVAAFAQPGQFKDTGLKLYYHDGTNLLSVSVFTADLPAGTYVFGSQVGNCFYTIGVLPK